MPIKKQDGGITKLGKEIFNQRTTNGSAALRLRKNFTSLIWHIWFQEHKWSREAMSNRFQGEMFLN